MAKLITMLRAQTRTSGLTIEADAAHPNKLKFKGILTRLDEPSTKPPQGSMEHLIQMPSDVAKKRLETLIGMGVNYAENLDAHEITHKVGVIEKAWIKGNALWVSGYVWVGDFPDAEKVLSTKGLGMSMELTHVLVEDRDADPWVLKDFVFTGATFLRKTNAAYFDTEAIAASASTSIFITTEAAMPKTNATTRAGSKKPVIKLSAQEIKLANLTAASASASITKALGTPLASIAASLDRSNKVNEEILARLNAEGDDEDDDDTMASGDGDDDDNDVLDEKGTKVKAGKKKPAKKDDDDSDDDFDEDEDDPDGDDDDDEDDDDVDSSNALVDAATETGTDPDAGDCDEPGHVNEDAEDRGNTTTLEDKQGPIKSAKMAAAKYKKAAGKWKTKALKFSGLAKSLQAENARLRAKAEAAGTKVSAASREAVRQTLTSSALTILTKNGMDAGDLRASGQALSTEEVDAMLKNLPHPLEVEDRIAFKRELQAAGLMVVTAARKTRA